MEALQDLAEVVPNGSCRQCWHSKTGGGRRHFTYNCVDSTLRRPDYRDFKSGRLYYASGKICPLCLSPYQLPFQHPRPEHGKPASASSCEYPDALKEHAWIVWRDKNAMEAIFSHLGVQVPLSLMAYKRFLVKEVEADLLGLAVVLSTYYLMREASNEDEG